MINTPRVESVIAKVMARFPGKGEASDRNYYPAVHQELAPLARTLETETITMQARIQDLETWQRTICELLAPDGDDVRPEDAHGVVSCLRETLATAEHDADNLHIAHETMRGRVMDAIAEAIGDAYDCTRVWSAWGIGTMGPDDFQSVTGDASRVAEIADAAIAAMIAHKVDSLLSTENL